MTATRASAPILKEGASLRSFRRAFRVALVAVLLICAALFVLWTWHWPLVNDAAMIHYVVFLMDHGMAPYRDVPEMNLPGTFLIDWLVMHTYGGGSLACRLFDLTVLLGMGAGLVALARPYDWLAGLFAGVLMMVLHGRDGLIDTAQRDLTIAALLVLGYGFLFRARRRQEAWAAGLFGFSMAAAGTMKPTTLPLMVLLLALLVVALRQQGKPVGRVLAAGVAGMLLPIAAVGVFLVREQAVRAFVHSLQILEPYFAGIARRPLSFLLVHSVSPVMPLVILWILLGAGFTAASWRGWNRPWSVERWERVALVLGALAALGAYVVEGKGYPDERYGFLVLLLLIISLDLAAALRGRGLRLGLAVLGLGFGAFFLVPQSLAKVKQYDWRNREPVSSMEAELRELGGSRLSGHVQCIDTNGGCGPALYGLKLVPATSLSWDFLVFGPADNPEVREMRARFLPQWRANPPWVILVTSRLFPNRLKDFGKLALWPDFGNFLAVHYRLCVQKRPARSGKWGPGPHVNPPTYRIYLLDGWDQSAPCAGASAAGS